MVDVGDLEERDVSARRAFTVGRSHTTNVFGEQAEPPGLPAGADATPDEAVRAFGSPDLLAWVEFVARESLRGHLPPGTGTAGIGAEVDHREPARLGTALVVETALVGVDGSRLTMRGTVERADDGAVVGTVRTEMAVVDRERFRASLR